MRRRQPPPGAERWLPAGAATAHLLRRRGAAARRRTVREVRSDEMMPGDAPWERARSARALSPDPPPAIRRLPVRPRTPSYGEECGPRRQRAARRQVQRRAEGVGGRSLGVGEAGFVGLLRNSWNANCVREPPSPFLPPRPRAVSLRCLSGRRTATKTSSLGRQCVSGDLVIAAREGYNFRHSNTRAPWTAFPAPGRTCGPEVCLEV
jgi:hypothetical protein